MRTTKPFSTISYNSKEFLYRKCRDLVKDGVITFFAFIEHIAEEDEKKNHIHLYMIPSGQVDTDKLREDIQEVLPNGEIHRCLLFKSSKFADWYLYSMHDKDYLMLKCQSRKYHYNPDDFIYDDYDQFIQLYYSSDFSKYKRMAKFREFAESGVSFAQLCSNGLVPVQQIFQYREMYNLMCSAHYNKGLLDKLERNGNVTHSPGELPVIVDDEDPVF